MPNQEQPIYKSIPEHKNKARKRSPIEDIPLYKLTYDLNLYILQCTQNAPKQLTILRDEFQKNSIDLVRGLYKAYFKEDRQQRFLIIKQTLEDLSVLSFTSRLMYDSKVLAPNQFSHIIKLTQELGVQMEAWKNKTSSEFVQII
ncbi:MAG: four helix bundle protein [Sulfuricurvum sp.]